MTINGKKERLDRVEELLAITAVRTTENFKQLQQYRAEFRREMKITRDEHNREMKEIRALFKKMIQRIAV